MNPTPWVTGFLVGGLAFLALMLALGSLRAPAATSEEGAALGSPEVTTEAAPPRDLRGIAEQPPGPGPVTAHAAPTIDLDRVPQGPPGPLPAALADPSAEAVVGKPAPDFEASNLYGERFRLSQWRGRPVLLNFWFVGCPGCTFELADLQALREAHRDRGLVVLAVNLGNGYQRAALWLHDLEVALEVAMDPDLRLARAYQLLGLPSSFFIDRQGVIRDQHVGVMTREIMAAKAKEVLP